MKFKLLEHNTVDQLKYGGHDYDDTKKHLKIGQIYKGEKEVHGWHTYIIINNNKFNSVCFEELSNTSKDTKMKEIKMPITREDFVIFQYPKHLGLKLISNIAADINRAYKDRKDFIMIPDVIKITVVRKK